MKSLIILVFALVFAIFLTACNGGGSSNESYSDYESNSDYISDDDYEEDDYSYDYEDGGSVDWVAKEVYFELLGGNGESIYFHGHGSNTLQFNNFAQFGGFGSIYGGLEYTISGNELTVTDDGEFLASFQIYDTYTLIDDEGNTYAVEGTGNYRLDSDDDSDSIIYFGEFAGDKGTVYVTESYFPGTVDLAFSLIGDLYLMSSLTIEPDGVSAANDGLTMRIDGDLLIIEAIDPEYEDYAGLYEKQ